MNTLILFLCINLLGDEQESKHGEADASIFCVVLLNKFLMASSGNELTFGLILSRLQLVPKPHILPKKLLVFDVDV